MDALFFTVAESAALMRAVYPNYPDLRNPRPAPEDLRAWLEAYRCSDAARDEKPPAGLRAELS